MNTIFKNPENFGKLKPLYKKEGYFDAGLATIEDAMHNNLKLEQLPKKIQKDFGFIIKTDKDGVIKGVQHMQNHHIALKEKPEFKELFKRAEISIDDPIHRILLPDAIGKDLYPTARSLHSGFHNEAYYKGMMEQTKKALSDGIINNWTTTQYKEKIIKIVSPTRKQLEAGTVDLNKAKTLMEKLNAK